MIAPRGTVPVHYEDIEKQLARIFKTILFDPIVKVIQEANPQLKPKFSNSADDELRRALKTGEVQYLAGIFSGKFRSSSTRAIQSLGGRWDKRAKVFRLDQAKVPGWVKAESAAYHTTAKAAHATLNRSLDEIQRNLDSALDDNKVKAGRMVDRVAADFRDVAKALEIHPVITDEQAHALSEGYTNNMKLWIKKWCEEEIVDLRGRVEKNALEGFRFDKLIDQIQNRYSVSLSKAKFLARQETALFVSKFNEGRVKEAGVVSYRWSTSHDRRVRDDHKNLDGKVFLFSDPPIVDPAKGRRANPGEDFNCRCVPIPILKKALAKS